MAEQFSGSGFSQNQELLHIIVLLEALLIIVLFFHALLPPQVRNKNFHNRENFFWLDAGQGRNYFWRFSRSRGELLGK